MKYEETKKQEILRLNNYQKYWTSKFSSQSIENRKDGTATNWTNVIEDIRDWNEEQ